MSTAKQDVRQMLDWLPEDCSLEDIQYHLYVAEKVQRGSRRAETEGTLSQTQVEGKLAKWLDR
ncbi:hypothetical protein EQG41_10595 [Billgrantia azerbaijanica]|nr:hypothetical protein EQG41_10595 [Halomonas azerbaijanica]